VRMSPLVTSYPTGVPFVSARGFVLAMSVMAIASIAGDDMHGAVQAAAFLAGETWVAYVEHRLRTRFDTPRAGG
jgi:hypothetical protein